MNASHGMNIVNNMFIPIINKIAKNIAIIRSIYYLLPPVSKLVYTIP